MYEFVQTKTGWRVFWGIDPLANQPEDEKDGGEKAAPEEPAVLPFRPQADESEDRPAA